MNILALLGIPAGTGIYLAARYWEQISLSDPAIVGPNIAAGILALAGLAITATSVIVLILKLIRPKHDR